MDTFKSVAKKHKDSLFPTIKTLFYLSAFLLSMIPLSFNATANTQTHLKAYAPVTVCDDENLWPPYVFTKDSKVTGAMVELLDAIFKKTQIDHTLTLTSWKRCLYQVEHFSGEPRFEVFINGTFSEERAQKFLVSDQVYSSGNAYFYSKTQFPVAPEINKLSDLKNYSVCGVHGYNYEMYGLTSSDLSVTAADLHSLFRLLKSNRCDIILNAYSVPFGSLFTDKPMLDNTVDARIIESLPKQSFHIFVSRKTPRAKYLISEINQALQALKEDGTIHAIFSQYLPECGADC